MKKGDVQVQESLTLKKYEKDIKAIHASRKKQKDKMKAKLEKKGFDFQRDWEKLERKLEGKELTERDIYLKALCLRIAPTISGASIQIRSGFESKIHEEVKREIYKDLPTTTNIFHGIMALLEPELKRFYKDLKKHYEANN